jgi:hypothetical protein
MTDIVSVGPGAVATQVVAEGDGETLVINTGPATVFFGDNNAIRALDGSGVVPISPLSYLSVTGEKDLYACVLTGQRAALNVITGGLNFFLPLTSLTIPYGSTGQRIVINPPAFPGSIVGYNPAGLIEFIISPNGYLIYDATGGALNHLFIALQNQAGTDTFGNPFAKGIQVGPQTGPQVLIAGGNPAVVSFPLNDTGFDSSKPYLYASNGVGIARYSSLTLDGPTTILPAHDDFSRINLNSPNVDGSSSANMDLSYVDTSNTEHAYVIVDYTGAIVQACSIFRSTQPGTGTSVTNPAVTEQWHSLGTLAGYTVLVGRYRFMATNQIEIEVSATSGGTNAASIAFQNVLPPAYRPAVDTRRVLGVAGGAFGTVLPNLLVSASSGSVTLGQNTNNAINCYGHAIISLD